MALLYCRVEHPSTTKLKQSISHCTFFSHYDRRLSCPNLIERVRLGSNTLVMVHPQFLVLGQWAIAPRISMSSKQKPLAKALGMLI